MVLKTEGICFPSRCTKMTPEEKVRLEKLDRVLSSPTVREQIAPIISRVQAKLARKIEALMTWEPIPLQIYGRWRRCYKVITIGVSAEPCVTESGVAVEPQVDVQHAPEFDTIIIPGGSGIHDPRFNKKIIGWLNRRAPATRRIAALGSGIYALAGTGLLDGRQVVIHWRFAKDVALQFPKLRVNAGNLFAKHGAFYT
jgi:transcriptional regulator GlxA family with amidase domain